MGMFDDLPQAQMGGLPPTPRSVFDDLPVAPTYQPKAAEGAMESLQAGWQGSVPGLFLRGQLPDLISDPQHSKWWERLLTGGAQLGADILPMALGGAFGGAAGTVVGGAVTANPAGAIVGGIAGSGAGMFGIPAAMRETLTQAYKRGEISTAADFWNMMREVAATTAKEAGIGVATFGAGSIAAKTVGKALAPAIGESITVPTATKIIGGADVAAQIATMVSMPAALQGRLPDAQEFMDAALVIGGAKLAHVTGSRLFSVYEKTGKTPAEQVADIQKDPKLAEEYTKPETPEEVAKREDWLRNPLKIQENLFIEKARLDELERQVEAKPTEGKPGEVKPIEVTPELEMARARVAELESQLKHANDFNASADRVYEDFYRQALAADQARKDAGLSPLGEEHARAVATLVKRNAATIASTEGMLPEDVYRERYPTFKDAAQIEADIAEAAIPPEAPRFPSPVSTEVDMFGEPIQPPMVPRVGVPNLETVEVPIADLKLSKEVPQFKAKANEEGIVQPLGGNFDRTGVGPIQVWERLDGTKEIISGRHRFDLAKRSGEATIPAQIHREADGFSARQAANLDAELNIREEQGSVADYVQHFKATDLSREAADERGLLARAKGRAGFAIAANGTADTIAAHRAGLLSDEAALSISLAAPGVERLQALGRQMVQDGKSILFAVNTMKSVAVMAAERSAAGHQGDIFGFDDSALKDAQAMAKKASAMQRAIAEQIASVSGAAKRPELARKFGVDVQDPEGIQKKVAELRQEQSQWDNWPMYPELVAKLRGLEEQMPAPVSAEPQSPPSKYSSEVQAKLDEAEAQYRHDVETINKAYATDPQYRDKQLHGLGMRYAAEKRQITGELTVKEQAAKDAREKGNYIGKEVMVDGFPAKVTGNPFGRVTVEFADGVKKTVDADQIKPRDLFQTADQFELQPETPADLAAKNKEALEQAKRKLAEDRKQDKSATVTADQADLFNTQGTLFQSKEDPRDLLIQHNLTAANLLHAVKMGGIPVPSLAVTNKSHPLTNFGEITLLGSKEMADPKGYASTKVFGADIYSPRYPTITYKVDSRALKKLNAELAPFRKEGGREIYGGEITKVEDLTQNDAFRAYILDKTGKTDIWDLRSGDMDAEASRMLSEAGAEEKLFKGFDYNGNRRYQPHTLENVVKILKKELRGGENFNYGVGSIRAKFTPQFRSIEQIRKAKGRLMDKASFEAVKDEIDSEFDSLRNDLAQYHSHGDEFGFGDVMTQMMYDAAGMGIPRALKENMFKDVPVEQQKGIAEFLGKLRTLPAEYFEAKILRDVDLAEFSGAVVPDNVDPKVIEALQARGIKDIRTYKKGDEADRKEKIGSFDDLLFQKQPQDSGATHLASYNVAERLITTLQGANKSSVLHELGHHFLENLKYFAQREGASDQIKADWETARREFAIGETGDIGTASHEQMARTWERYLGTGEAPSKALQGVFSRFKAWMLDIYNDIRNLGVPINPEIRRLFDHMLATEEEIQAAKEMNIPRIYAPEAMRAEAEKIVPGRKIEPGDVANEIARQPFADELPEGPGEAPNTSHVNYKYINSPLDVKLTMQRMAEIDQEAIQKQRGGTNGVKSWEESNAEQARYINDILGGSEDTLRLLAPRDPNAAGPDVRLGVLKKLAVGAAKDSARLRDIILEKGHDATVQEQLEYLGSIERARMIQAEFLGERASVARALNALKDVTEGSGEIGRMLDAIGYGEGRELFQASRVMSEQDLLKQKLDEILLQYKGKSVLDIARLHREIGTLKGTFEFAKEQTTATTWEKLLEGWRAALLSGPVTHTTNLFGTGAFQVMRAPVDALAAVIGMARGASIGMGESDRASVSESIARITGMLGGIQDGLKVAWHTFKEDDPTGKTEAYKTAIEGRKGEIIRIPLRMMAAEDALVNTMYSRGELMTLAMRKAFDENMNPATREFADRVNYLVDHPTPEMAAIAENAATRMTFNLPLGEKGAALQHFVKTWSLQWVIPFIRTPINIAKELLRMSPFAPVVGEWRDAIRAGGIERDRALAEIALGSGVMAVTMAAAFNGNISGAGSPDPGKNRGKAGVWQPYSVLIGNTWYEYSRIQPTGTLMGMAADVANIWDHMTDEEKDKIPKMMAVAFSNAITNQTFLQGITNIVNAMSDPVRFAPRFLQGYAGSVVPNIIAQPTAMADPVVREVNGMIDAIQARIPGLRQELLPKRDWLGEPEVTKERMGLVLPVREQPVSDDKVRQEAARLDLSMAAAPKKTHIGKGTGKLGDVKLEPEEQDRFEQLGGQMAHRILANIVAQPGYDQLPDLVQRKIFRQVLTESHKFAAAMALGPSKRDQYIRSITEKVTEELNQGVEQ